MPYFFSLGFFLIFPQHSYPTRDFVSFLSHRCWVHDHLKKLNYQIKPLSPTILFLSSLSISSVSKRMSSNICTLSVKMIMSPWFSLRRIQGASGLFSTDRGEMPVIIDLSNTGNKEGGFILGRLNESLSFFK